MLSSVATRVSLAQSSSLVAKAQQTIQGQLSKYAATSMSSYSIFQNLSSNTLVHKTQKRYMNNPLRPTGIYVPTDANSEYQTFDFTAENWELCKQILDKYPPQYKASATAPFLDLAQRQCGGWLPFAAMNKIANILNISPMDVYEVASFYTMFNWSPVGKYFVQVCGTTPCHAMRAPEIMTALKNRLGVENGGTSADGKFTLLEVECLGACVNAPMMQINDDYYEDLTPETAVAVIDGLAAGKTVPFGPQNGKRKYAEPYGPKTSLTEPPTGPYAPYLEKLDQAAAAAASGATATAGAAKN